MGYRYRILKCINTCQPCHKGPFGVCEAMGTDEGCIKDQIYYAGKSNLGHYYVSRNMEIDAPAHRQDTFLGLFEAENFEEIEIIEKS